MMYMLIGLPASGKSTFAKKLAQTEGAVIHETDEIRERLHLGWSKEDHEKTFQILHQEINEDLKNGRDIIYDATNMSRKDRRRSFSALRNKGKCVAVVIATPYNICIQRDENRQDKVGEDVINRMIRRFDFPVEEEGFDKVHVVYTDSKPSFTQETLDNFNQENHNHSLSLGEHMRSAERYAKRFVGNYNYPLISVASKYHDIGKLITKDFHDKKGNLTEDAHYYGHDKASAYMFLSEIAPRCCALTEVDKRIVTTVINKHMEPYLAWKQSEKARERDLAFFGDQIIEMIDLVHEADVKAH